MKRIIYSVLFTVFITSCNKLVEPEFKKIERFKVKKAGLQETTISFFATFYNPNNVGVAVKEAVFDVYIDSIYMGKFTQPQQIDVGKKANFSIPLEGKVSLLRALGLNLPKLIGRDVGIRADGSVKIGKAGVFINKDIKYSGKQKIDLDFIKNPAEAGSFP